MPSHEHTSRLALVTVAWGLLFAAVHAYWAAGGPIGMNGDPADTPAAQAYIGVIALVGLASAGVAAGLLRTTEPRRRRVLVRLARAGGAALLLGVVVGVARWAGDGSLAADGAGGIVITAFFLVGGVLFSALGWRASPGGAQRPEGPNRSVRTRSGANPASSSRPAAVSTNGFEPHT